MKCIKKHGEIKRVRDNDARNLVATQDWSFCPKSEWKMKTGKSKKDEASPQAD